MASMINKSIEYERLNGLLGESPYCLKLWNDNLIVCDSDGSNSSLKLCDCLELMCATGDRTHTRQIVSLYKRVDNNIKSQQHLPEVLTAKMAIAAYGASGRNARDNAIKLADLYNCVFERKINELKGAAMPIFISSYMRSCEVEV
ncbi:MAG: hypothetical protein SOS24_05995 [Clostridia bacterium]|nr:hypothetical protein [Clostridia bacterium]